MTPRANNRRLPLALGMLLAAAGFSFAPALRTAHAQAQAQGGNPVDALPTPPVPTRPSTAPRGTRILQPPPQAQPPAQQGQAITPTRFDIEGVQSIAFEEVAALFAPFAGQPTTVGKLAEAAQQVTAMYQQQGYALSFAYLPEQDFSGGVVRVVAVEGHIATVQIEGEAGKAEPKIRALAERIRQERPLRMETFERYTQLMGQLPGIGVEATAVPPTTTDGAGALQLQVSRQPYQVSLGTDIRTKRPRAVVTGVINDPFVAGGRLSGSTMLGTQDGERYGALAYSQMVGTEGLTLRAETSLYKGDPDAHLNTPPAIRRFTDYRRAEFSARYPLVLKARESLYLSGGIYGINNADDYRNPATGAMLTDEVKVRAVYAQASVSKATETRSRYLALRLTRGLDALGASSAVRANFAGALPVNRARLDFTRVGVDASQRNDWGNRWGTAVSMGAQYSPHILPSTERVSFGGTRFARGYAAGEVASDSGWGVGLEVNRSFGVDMAYVTQIQPYVLLEAARVYSQAGALAFSKLSSASLGVRVSGGGYYTVDVALSKPTGDPSPENPRREPRLSALISYNFSKR
ncbi:MAG: POTRA domain-containing protein [Polaromonas sp.]|nr:POTRA domain-containing protein [Polaromonas sp.]